MCFANSCDMMPLGVIYLLNKNILVFLDEISDTKKVCNIKIHHGMRE